MMVKAFTVTIFQKLWLYIIFILHLWK